MKTSRVGMMALALAVTVAGVLAAGCTGAVMPNQPGNDTSLDPAFNCAHCVGPLAIEKDQSLVWLMHGGTRTLVNGTTQQRELLAAIDPTSGAATDVLDLSGSTDHRLVFPAKGRALLVDKPATGYERLTLLDTVALTSRATTTQPGVYNGTRTSPSGRILVVA